MDPPPATDEWSDMRAALQLCAESEGLQNVSVTGPRAIPGGRVAFTVRGTPRRS